jgi:hypothetical protein
VSVPERMMVAMFAMSCSALPRALFQSAVAAETPMSDAAGIVYTEMSTPMCSPDFAVVC